MPNRIGRLKMTEPYRRPTSITHQHLLAVLATELSEREPSGDAPIRILDAGCGNCRLLEHLAAELPNLFPGRTFAFYGFDVSDHGVQTETDYFSAARDRLSETSPAYPWHERLSLIGQHDPWPYADATFTAVVSNQVLEHVHDHSRFLGEVNRSLQPDGFSAHLFPLRHYIYESHLNLPLAHRIRNHDALRAYVGLCSRLGLGKFRETHRRTGVSLAEFAERHADYMHYFTSYRTATDFLSAAKTHHLRASFRYTQEYYIAKLRQLLGSTPRLQYRKQRNAMVDWISVTMLKYVSGITLFLEKREAYTSRR